MSFTCFPLSLLSDLYSPLSTSLLFFYLFVWMMKISFSFWQRTTILLQRSARQAPWPSPYLDDFGEEVSCALELLLTWIILLLFYFGRYIIPCLSSSYEVQWFFQKPCGFHINYIFRKFHLIWEGNFCWNFFSLFSTYIM